MKPLIKPLMKQMTHGLILFNLTAATAALLLVSGCSHKQVKTGEDAISKPDSVASDLTSDGASSDTHNSYGLTTIHFAFDSNVLDTDEKSILKKDAEILKSNPNLRIQLEGHCDQRGGIQYNLALGEKRANAVKHFLEDMGIGGARLSTISYGKERPLDPSENEEAYSKNRRVNFVITKGLG